MVKAGLGKRLTRSMLKSKNAIAGNFAGRIQAHLENKALTESTLALRQEFSRKIQERPEACLCQEAYDVYSQYRAACAPKRFTELKLEWAEFKGKVLIGTGVLAQISHPSIPQLFSPSKASIAEFKSFIMILVQLLIIFLVGTYIGRGGFSWIDLQELQEDKAALEN